MTIIVPTGELVGLLGDVIPFADTDKEFTLHTRVLFRWDGEMLHAEATDAISWGHSFWHPKDDPDSKSEQETLFDQWGGDDDPWQVTLELPDAKDVVKNFKLGAKEWGVLLRVTYDQQHDRVTISRSRDAEHSALRQDINGRVIVADDLRFPDVETVLARRELPDGGRAVDRVAFTSRRLASFDKVRQRGPVEIEFWGRFKTARIRIGGRFLGAVVPARVDDEPVARVMTDADLVSF